MDLINLMRLALDEDEQTGEFANIDPHVLHEAQQRVAQLDKDWFVWKIRSFKSRIKSKQNTNDWGRRLTLKERK